MSGHSKWSKVKHQKATTDVQKAQAFTKASRAVTLAVKEGGGVTDPQGNFHLRLAIDKAKEVNMPKENIERAIAKGKGEGDIIIESLLYEGYGPGGVGLIIEAASENRQRTVSAVKNILDRYGGVFASPGAVSYQFVRSGVIVVERQSTMGEEEFFNLALDSGADDIVSYDDSVEVYSSPLNLAKVRDQLEERAVHVNNAEIIYKPTIMAEVTQEILQKNLDLVSALSELEDVQRVYTNLP